MFSSGVILADLDDYIAPSQACTQPPSMRSSSKTPQPPLGESLLHVSKEDEVTYTSSTLEPAKINLADCLACSGCITTAESVLVAQQSHSEVYQVLKQNQQAKSESRHQDVKLLVVSIAEQVRASFAALYQETPTVVHKKLTSFFKMHLGFDHVVDSSFSRDLALMEGAKEFVNRFSGHQQGLKEAVLPLVSSACPGWICYAEKTHASVLPHISQVKSPQQIMGSLIKTILPRQLGLNLYPGQIYHVSVMPCFDKKLEASRSMFATDNVRDVDCVLTPIEIQEMLNQEQLNWKTIPLYDFSNIPALYTKGIQLQNDGLCLVGTPGSSSGGYMSYVFRYAAKTLFNIDVSQEDIALGQGPVKRVLKQGRNRSLDFVQFLLIHPDTNDVLLRFAIAYGFKNIQNVVRKIKTNQSSSSKGNGGDFNQRLIASQRNSSSGDSFDYVEIMACPSGCINGGGQLRAPSSVDPKDWIQMTENAYNSTGRDPQLLMSPEQNQVALSIYEHLCQDEVQKKTLLYTTYQALEKPIANALGVKW